MDTNTLSTVLDLLKQPSPRPSLANARDNKKSNNNTPKSKPEAPTRTLEKSQRPTIFDLASCDRYRILKLIEELLDSQEEVDQLKQKIEDQKLEFREKRSALIKKLDLLGEKHDKALSEVQSLKEKHSESLTVLEGKISMVSQKFEESISEIDELRKANSDLKKENKELLKLSSQVTCTVESMQGENSKLSLQLKKSQHREKSYRRQLRKFSLCDGMQTGESVSSQPCSDEEQSISRVYVPARINNFSRSGAGDFVLREEIPSSALKITTIKSPVKMHSEKTHHHHHHHSRADRGSRPEVIHKTINPDPNLKSKQVSFRESGNHPENREAIDSAIIENLFFRF